LSRPLLANRVDPRLLIVPAAESRTTRARRFSNSPGSRVEARGRWINPCWDAVSVTLEHYFNPASSLTQEQFAVKALGVPLTEADEPFFLSTDLTDLKLLNGQPGMEIAHLASGKGNGRESDQGKPVVVAAALQWK